MVWPALPGNVAAAALALQFQLEMSQWWSVAQLAQWQLRQLHTVLAHARETIPFWRRRFDAAGFDPATTPDFDAFRLLPLLRREDMLTSRSELLSPAVPPEHGTVTRGGTSGSTGIPVTYYGTGLTDFFWRAFTLREHFWHRRDFSGKLAAIRLKVENGETPGWGPATDSVLQTGPCALLNLRTDIDDQLDWLERQAPQYLISNATNLRWLAERALERGLRLPGLLQTRSFGGPVDERARQSVRDAWNVDIADLYTAEEVGYIALQCPDSDNYHLQAENLITEILGEDGRPCEAGQIGRVVVTTLHNFAMPLFRYDLGDYAEAGAACPCGRGLPAIRRVIGRERNILRLPDGRRHWPSFPIDKWSSAVPVIRQLQIVQKTLLEMHVRIVAPRDLSADEASQLIEVLQGCLGHPFRMTVERVGEIGRSGNYKFEDFVSECKD